MTRNVAVTIILSLAIGCALSLEDMITPDGMNPTQESDMGSSTMEACYDSGWTTKCECPESSPNACGHTLTTICDGVETRFNTENLTRAECYVPGEWAEWAEWATCNTTCPEAGGWRNRTRECDSATMKPWQNAECNSGSNVDFQLCACGEWGSWSAPSTCSVSCDGGYQTRQRECQAPPNIPDGAGAVCEGDAEDEDECGTDECPLDDEEAANGVYFCLETSMTLNDYIKIRPLLTTAIIKMINEWCWQDNFALCCPEKKKPTFTPKKYVPEYVNNKTFELKGGFKDEEADLLCAMMYVDPDIDTNEMCNGRPTASGRKKRQTINLSASITSAVANSSSFTSAVTATAAKQGFNVTVAKVLSTSAAASLKASLSTTTIATTVASNATTARATAAPPSQLGLIVGVSVGGGLGLVAIILVIVVVVKKKMAKTGIAEITASGDEGAGHQHERRHRELEDGNVAYPAPQYPAAGAVAPVSQS